jgi:hypothetical protein
MTFRSALRLACLVPALVLAAGPAARAQEVGTMTAFQTVIARLNGPALGVGAGIFLNDRLRSNATGLGMIVFNDESSAKIGPNASLTIDEFVYDPVTRRGTSTFRADSGLARFYGGQISKRGRMNVRTPHMVLGIRGGIIEVGVERDRSEGILRAGQMTCRLGEMHRIITKPGFSCASDGRMIVVAPGGGDRFAILDSTDRIAGTGIPGEPGNLPGIDRGCASAAGTRLPGCASRDGMIPRPETRDEPDIPDFPIGRQ